MQATETKNEGLNRGYEVTIPSGDLDDLRDEKLKEYSKTVKLPGFRPGKVPLTLMRQRYGKAVLGEIIESAVNDSSQELMKEKGIRPALQPKIEIKEFDEGKDLTYTMEVEILPEFEVAEYKGLTLEKPVSTAGDKEVNEALERIAEQRKSNKKIEEDRASAKGDIVVISFNGRTADDNKEHPGMQSDSHYLELGSGQFIPGFEEQLEGKKPGDEIEVKVTFPENYQADLAGRDAVFEVKIKEIRIPVKAEIDEDMAKGMGFDDVNALKDAVHQQIQGEFDKFSRMKIKRALLDIMDEQNKFDVPTGMIEMEYEAISKQMKAEQQQAGEEDSKISEEDEKELREIAERRVRLGLILAEIGNKNNIAVSEQELRNAVISESRKYPGQEREVFDFFQKNPQALESLKAPLFEEKVVDFVLELAEVTDKEVDPDALTSEEDDKDAKDEKKEEKKKPAKKSEKKSDKKPAAKKSAKKDDKESDGKKKSSSASSKKTGAKKSSSKSSSKKK